MIPVKLANDHRLLLYCLRVQCDILRHPFDFEVQTTKARKETQKFPSTKSSTSNTLQIKNGTRRVNSLICIKTLKFKMKVHGYDNSRVS